VLFEDIGPIITDFVDLDFGKFKIYEKSATGKVVYIDRFGNIITNIKGGKLKNVLDFDNKINVLIGKKTFIVKYIKSYDFVKKGQMLATIGSSNKLEIAINQGNAGKKLDVKIDDDIKILF
jgi:hypothetical protein